MSTGRPRPLSLIEHEPSTCSVTSMRSQKPARCSSIELSSTSKTQWCSPRSSVGPIYIPGRWRTPARPSSLSIFEASYLALRGSFSASDIVEELGLILSGWHSISRAVRLNPFSQEKHTILRATDDCLPKELRNPWRRQCCEYGRKFARLTNEPSRQDQPPFS